jgi:hypothetical protein
MDAKLFIAAIKGMLIGCIVIGVIAALFAGVLARFIF